MNPLYVLAIAVLTGVVAYWVGDLAIEILSKKSEKFRRQIGRIQP